MVGGGGVKLYQRPKGSIIKIMFGNHWSRWRLFLTRSNKTYWLWLAPAAEAHTDHKAITLAGLLGGKGASMTLGCGDGLYDLYSLSCYEPCFKRHFICSKSVVDSPFIPVSYHKAWHVFCLRFKSHRGTCWLLYSAQRLVYITTQADFWLLSDTLFASWKQLTIVFCPIFYLHYKTYIYSA